MTAAVLGKATVAVTGEAARRIYGKVGLFLLLVCGMVGAVFACPYPVNIRFIDDWDWYHL